jgi:large subunit ribosomal protein L7Ae
MFSYLFQPSKMPKGEKAKGKKVALDPAVIKKQDTKKMANPLFEKRPKNFSLGWTTSHKEI